MSSDDRTQYPLTGYRLSGGGNDFLAFVDLAEDPSADQIRAWCTRGLSLGADGIFLLKPDPRGARMDYFNADGASADLCLNGTRCAALLARHLGWVEPPATKTAIRTAVGWIEARYIDEETVALAVSAPQKSSRTLNLIIGQEAYKAYLITVGVPILVVPWESSLSGIPIDALGPKLRAHADLGAAGANVMFVRFLAEARIEMRSFERGVEAETLACGTGALGSVAVARELGACGDAVRVLTGGGSIFTVTIKTGGEHWSLAGDARLLATTEISRHAESVPLPPVWS